MRFENSAWDRRSRQLKICQSVADIGSYRGACDDDREAFNRAAVVFLAEAGHLTAAGLLGLQVRRIGVCWKGPYIVRESGPPVANIITTLAGRLINLVLIIAWPLSHDFALANVIFGISISCHWPGPMGSAP